MMRDTAFDSGTPAGGPRDEGTQLDLWEREGKGSGQAVRARWPARPHAIDPSQLLLEIGRREERGARQGRGTRP